MQLSEGPRQILAGSLAAGLFLWLFFGLTLVWWAALLGGLLAYGAVLLIIRRKLDASETRLAGRITEADIRSAGQTMAAAADRLGRAEARVPEASAGTVAKMVEYVHSIRGQVMSDPEDYRRARRFITFYLDHIVSTVERYADLSEKSRGRHEGRLAPLARQIEDFVPALEKIDTACLENDFIALESQVEALASQLKRE